MHVFITGGTGTIGAPVVAELLAHDHTVLALARSEASARALESAGAQTLRGDLSDLDVVRAGAAAADGVVQLAFSRDYGSADAVAQGVAEETAAIRPWAKSFSAATARWWWSRARRGSPDAPRPRPTRCRPTGWSAVAAAR